MAEFVTERIRAMAAYGEAMAKLRVLQRGKATKAEVNAAEHEVYAASILAIAMVE